MKTTRPRLFPNHRRERLLGDEEAALQVHRDDVIEVALGHHQHQLVAGEAGGMDEDVEAALALDGEERVDGGGRGDVAADGAVGELFRLQGRFGGARGGVVAGVERDHLVAAGGERTRDREANPLGPSAHQRASHECACIRERTRCFNG